MANEIQRLTFGGNDPTLIEAGALELTFDGQTTSSMAAADLDTTAEMEATVQAALEALSNIGSGNVVCTWQSTYLKIEFQGSLANTNVAEITVASNTLKRKADTVSVDHPQAGVADDPTHVTITRTTSAVAQANEVQLISLGGAGSGTVDIDGNSTTATGVNLNLQGDVQAAMDTIWGSGNAAVTSNSGNWDVTFGGSLANTNVGQMTISANNTDGSPSISTTTQGSAGTHEVHTVAFDGVPDSGQFKFGSTAVQWNDNATAVSDAYDTAYSESTTGSGSIASGAVVLTFDDYASHDVETPDDDTLTNLGQHDITRFWLPDSPTEGTWKATLGGNDSAEIAYDASAGTVETALEGVTGGYAGTVTGTGTTADKWVFESAANIASQSWSASEVTALRKACSVTPSTDVEGSGGGGAIAGTCALTFGAGSSTLKGAGALLGSSAVVFGAGSSFLMGFAPVAGSAAMVFSAGSSTAIAIGTLAGSSALTFAAGSSTITATGALAGSSALVFAAGSSTLVGSGALAGSAATVFGAGSSTLIGAGALTGSSALTFAAGSSTLTASGTLAGSAALVFAAGSSTLTGSGALAGSSAMVFDDGSSTLIGSGALAGTSVATFAAGSSALTGTGTLAGAMALVFGAGNSTLTGSGALAGSAAMVFTPTAELSSLVVIATIWSHVAYLDAGGEPQVINAMRESRYIDAAIEPRIVLAGVESKYLNAASEPRVLDT